MSEMVNLVHWFVSKNAKFCVVWIIRFCSNLPACGKYSKELQIVFELLLLAIAMET